MIQIGNKDTNYGNWVPAAMMKTCVVAIAVVALLTKCNINRYRLLGCRVELRKGAV